MPVSFGGIRGFVVLAALPAATLAASSVGACPPDPDSTVVVLSYDNFSPITYGMKWLRRYDFEVRRGHADLVVHGSGDELVGTESAAVPEAMWSQLLAKGSVLPADRGARKRIRKCVDAGSWSVAVVERGRTVGAMARDCPDDAETSAFFTPVKSLFDMRKYPAFAI